MIYKFQAVAITDMPTDTRLDILITRMTTQSILKELIQTKYDTSNSKQITLTDTSGSIKITVSTQAVGIETPNNRKRTLEIRVDIRRNERNYIHSIMSFMATFFSQIDWVISMQEREGTYGPTAFPSEAIIQQTYFPIYKPVKL